MTFRNARDYHWSVWWELGYHFSNCADNRPSEDIRGLVYRQVERQIHGQVWIQALRYRDAA